MKQRIENNKGFSMIELLVVVFLTGIIMTLVFYPLTKSFEFMRRAEVMVRAQDNARFAMAQISRDLQNAMFVYDNTQSPINFPIPENFGSGVEITPVEVYYAKVDLVLPRMRGYCTSEAHPNGVSREYERGEEAAPTCPQDGNVLELRPVEPLAPDTKIVRYFIGLKDPGRQYANRYYKPRIRQLLQLSGTENMFVLYRAEFSPFDDHLFSTSDPIRNLQNPNFFYDNTVNPYGVPYCQAWKKIARPMVTLRGTELVQLEFNVNAAGTTCELASISPTVKFAPTQIYNDPLVPVKDTENDPEHGDVPPTMYKATYGNWLDSPRSSQTRQYEITLRRDANNIYKTGSYLVNGEFHTAIYKSGVSNIIFDITNYVDTSKDPGGTNWQGYKYGVGMLVPEDPELAFTVDTRKGLVNFAFPHINPGISDNLSQQLGGRVPISFAMSTVDLNSGYQEGVDLDRYRMWVFNMPSIGLPGAANRLLKYGTIVPGMERVFGPNCTPGQSPDRIVQYNRIPFWDPFTEPGLNQYKVDIDYPVLEGNRIKPNTQGTAAVYFQSYQSQPGLDVRLPQDTDDKRRFKMYVLYYEQNNKKGDNLKASYITKDVLTVTLGIRAYEPNTGTPHFIQLTNKLKLRNVVD